MSMGPNSFCCCRSRPRHCCCVVHVMVGTRCLCWPPFLPLSRLIVVFDTLAIVAIQVGTVHVVAVPVVFVILAADVAPL